MFVHRVQIRIHFTTESFHLRQNAQVYKNVAARDKVSTTKSRKESYNINGLGQKNIKIAKESCWPSYRKTKRQINFWTQGRRVIRSVLSPEKREKNYEAVRKTRILKHLQWQYQCVNSMVTQHLKFRNWIRVFIITHNKVHISPTPLPRPLLPPPRLLSDTTGH